MSQQQTYSEPAKGYPGQRDGSGHYADSYINDLGSAKQIDDIVLGIVPPVAQTQLFVIPATVDDSVTYTITINGVACEFEVDASSTQAELQAGMIDAINDAVGSAVTATAVGNDILVTADEPGVPFTFAIDTGTTDDITAGAATANVGDGTTYQFTVNGYVVAYETNHEDGIREVRDGLIDAGRAVPELQGVVTFNANGNNVRIQAVVPGTAFTTAESADPNLSIVNTQANTATQPIKFGKGVVKRTGGNSNDQSCMLPSATGQAFLGIVERNHNLVDATAAADAARPFSVMSIGKRGRWWVEVEDAVDAEGAVFCRHTATGTEELGSFRSDADTADADEIAGAKFKTSTSGRGMALLELNLP